ncbi:serine threonine- kinase [Chlorella sorokiniana]|uniref:Serine threonine-kinase n=1 Tax=Chlorella sorokiniana TaxID=3076 RepID=A0A2P6TNL0_CHLSO|nr:serine threonine- kinase [Chlorella sorokiniana]|eukprot:PRW50927.1 serine threonine- kinase [Chlorella sorokiniana]
MADLKSVDELNVTWIALSNSSLALAGEPIGSASTTNGVLGVCAQACLQNPNCTSFVYCNYGEPNPCEVPAAGGQRRTIAGGTCELLSQAGLNDTSGLMALSGPVVGKLDSGAPLRAQAASLSGYASLRGIVPPFDLGMWFPEYIADGEITQADIDAPAVQAGKKAFCSPLNNASLDLVMDYIYVDPTRSDANDLQCQLPPFNGTVEAIAAECQSLGILCRGFSYFSYCSLDTADVCELGEPLNGPRQYPYHPQIFMNESQWNPLSVFYAKTGSMLAEIPPSFNKGGYYIVGSGEVLSPAPAPPPLMPPSPPPAPPSPLQLAPSPAAASPAGGVSPPAPPTPLDSSGGSSLAAGAVAGIAVGATCLLLMLVGAAFVWRRRRAAAQGSATGSLPPLDMLKLSTSEEDRTSTAKGSGLSGKTLPSRSSSKEVPLTGSGSGGGSGGGSLLSLQDGTLSLLRLSDFSIDHDMDGRPVVLGEGSQAKAKVGAGWDGRCAWCSRPVVLGEGSQAKVYRGKLGHEPAAIKMLRGTRLSSSERERFLREAAILKNCRSQHLVAFRGVYIAPTEVAVVTELCLGGTLYTALSDRVTWYNCGARIALEVALGLHYLHRNYILHLDLKSPNVLLSRSGRAKIGDCGLSQVLTSTVAHLSRADAPGSFAWASPEQLMGEPCSYSSDIWSLGVTFWEICTGEKPRRGQLREIQVPEEAPAEAVALIRSCWHRDPSQRPTADQIVQALQVLLGPEAAAEEGLEEEGEEGFKERPPGSGGVLAAALAAQPPRKPEPKERPANPFQTRQDKLFS